MTQSLVACTLGSPFVGEVLASAHRQLGRAPHLDATLAAWPYDPATSAMALRLNAGLHALARRGTFTDLSALYAGRHTEFDRAVGEALERGEPTLLTWMSHPTQTNEVRRSSAFMAALSVLAHRHGLPFELFEVGASAGLNLLLDRYAHDLGGVPCGQADSSLRLKPQWNGPPPPRADVRVASVRGVDLRPLQLDDPLTRERLMSYVWPGDHARSHYLRRAMMLARNAVPVVDRDSGGTWLNQRLREPQAAGTMRVVLHSMVLQYLPDDELQSVKASIQGAGMRATRDRPFARIGLEWNRDRTQVLLCVTSWSGSSKDGERTILAACHPYGAWIDWLGAAESRAAA
ncbi:hypothetical protein LK12_20950 [Novosphingobium malaysiense]|uniref:DUF2332 domain-containing protein n=1 Tax=Novosphingobium malaysiense TaxID=1348853 RepID=A0A0B1ZF90_9SPHN|nr:hypothetical protein LK12_20950 [Novosphingobium malaysiense]